MSVAASRITWTTRVAPLVPGPRLVAELMVHHTAYSGGGGVISVEAEQARMRAIEAGHLARGWAAAGYSKVIFGSGRAYDGRGWGWKQGANEDGPRGDGKNWSTYSLCFDGDFTSAPPTEAAMQTFRDLVAEGVALEWVSPGYVLLGHRDEIIPPGVRGKEHCAGRTVLQCTGKDCPGAGVYTRFDELKEEVDMTPEQAAMLKFVHDYLKNLKQQGSTSGVLDRRLDLIPEIEAKVDALAAAVAALPRPGGIPSELVIDGGSIRFQEGDQQ